MDYIVFLGTAGDVEVMARQQRASGGIILNLEKNQFHLDPGPSCLAAASAAGVSARETIAVLVSNATLLRSNDVNAAVSAMTLDGMDKHGVLLGSKSVIESEEAVLRSVYKRCVEGLVALSPGQKIGINEVTIYPVKTRSKDLDAVGWKLVTDKVVIGYPGDSAYYETMPADYEDCNVLVLNVKHPEGTKEEGHMNLEDAEMLIKKVKPKLALLTGFGSKLLKADLRDVARQLQRKTKVEITAVKDGQKVELRLKKK